MDTKKIIIAAAIIGLLAIAMFIPIGVLKDIGPIIAALIGLLAIGYLKKKMPDLRQLDTKIIIATIIGLSAIVCTYIYTQNTPLNQCIDPMEIRLKDSNKYSTREQAIINCIQLMNSHR